MLLVPFLLARRTRMAEKRRKLNGVPTTETHPGAVTLLTELGNTVTLTLGTPDVERVAHLLAEIIREDEAFRAAGEGDTE